MKYAAIGCLVVLVLLVLIVGGSVAGAIYEARSSTSR